MPADEVIFYLKIEGMIGARGERIFCVIQLDFFFFFNFEEAVTVAVALRVMR